MKFSRNCINGERNWQKRRAGKKRISSRKSINLEASKVKKPVVVLDTNIFISSVFWEGKPYEVVKKAINQEIVVFISQYIIDEIRNVLSRDFNQGKQEI